uniref:Non-structural maintenance of chromosomes element 4 n=1 Tax=Oncorhynchus kisutch TaxID=8019 RepID=A0A8C7JAL4_ONCKI
MSSSSSLSTSSSSLSTSSSSLSTSSSSLSTSSSSLSTSSSLSSSSSSLSSSSSSLSSSSSSLSSSSSSLSSSSSSLSSSSSSLSTSSSSLSTSSSSLSTSSSSLSTSSSSLSTSSSSLSTSSSSLSTSSSSLSTSSSSLSSSSSSLSSSSTSSSSLFCFVSSLPVRQAREAALDAQLLVLATDLGKEKASQLHAEGSAFDPAAFAEHLLSFMGLNRLEEEDEDVEGGASGGYLPQDAWQRVANRAQRCFRTAPSFHYMMGSFLAELPPPRQRVERQRKVPGKEAKRIMPTQLKRMEESHQEATEKEVERILGYLRSYFFDDPTSPISYYEFVIDPTSFSRSVENIFHTSFLVRDGLAKMYLDNHKLPCIAPVEEGEVEAGGASNRQQCVISISPKSWKELIEAFDITEPLIHAPSTQHTE